MNLTGQLIIAPPNIRQNFWQKSVILITENHARGSMGVIVNKRTKLSVREFSKQVYEECNIPGHMYGGGPVNMQALTLLHTSEWACENTMKINDEISLSSHQDLLNLIAMGNTPRQWRFILGLCAWIPNQLESEVLGRHGYDHNHSWLLASADVDSIFGLDGNDLWTNSIERSGMEFVQNLLD